MQTSSRAGLVEDIRSIIRQHFGELRQFASSMPSVQEQIPDDLWVSVEQLFRVCDTEPATLNPRSQQDARQCLTTVDRFLKQMNQPLDAEFRASSLGQIWLRGHQWLQEAAQIQPASIRDIRRLIVPSRPDVLEYLGNGLYEAKWWKPVPMMDVEILTRTESIDVCGEPFEPVSLPNGLAVRFSVLIADLAQSAPVKVSVED